MRTIAVMIWGIFTAVAAPAAAGMFPAEATYRLYIFGEFAGKDEVKITERGDAVLFESHSQIKFEDFVMDLRCRTEVARDDFSPRYFSYEGLRGGQQVSGTLTIDGDSLWADLSVGDDHFPSGTTLSGQKVLFENYIIEHQVLLLNTVAASDALYKRVQVFFPIDFASAECLAVVESEVEVDTTPRTVCRKYQFSIRGGSSFYGYFDPKRKLAVYMDFPATSTEVFLEGAFGDTPTTKYVRPESSP